MPAQSGSIGLPTRCSSRRPTPSPQPTARASPRTTGTAVCHSTDRPSVRRGVPNASRADNSSLRSRSCSTTEMSRPAPIRHSTAIAPAWSAARTMSNSSGSRSPVRVEVSHRGMAVRRGSVRAAVLRTYSTASGRSGSRWTSNSAEGDRSSAGSRAPGVARMLAECREKKLGSVSTVCTVRGTVQAAGRLPACGETASLVPGRGTGGASGAGRPVSVPSSRTALGGV